MRAVTIYKAIVYMMVLCGCLNWQLYGINWQPPATQISATQLPTRDVQIATDGLGNVLAVWIQANNLNDTAGEKGIVYGSRFDVTTSTWSPPFIISINHPDHDSVFSNNKNPQVVFVNSDGRAVVAYTNIGDSNDNLYISYIDPNNNITDLEQASDDTDGGRFSLAKYKPNQAILVWANNAQNKIRAKYYDGLLSDAIEVSADGPPPTSDNTRLNPFVAVQPGTGIPFIVYMQKSELDDFYEVVGVPLQSFTDPCQASYYTIFSQYNCVDGALNFPQIVFNPADNTPIVFFARKSLTLGRAFIAASIWNPPFVLSGADPQHIEEFDVISTANLADSQNIKFSVVCDAANYFKVVYTQNMSPYFTYGAAYIPTNNSAANDQISTASAANFNNIPAVVKSGGPTTTNIVAWEQSDKLFGASYTPGSAILPHQISSDGHGQTINGLALGIDSSSNIAMTAWNQGASNDSTQLFGSSGPVVNGVVSWGAPQQISLTTDLISDVQIATDNEGTVIAVWAQNGEIHGSRFDITTKKWSAPFLISESGSNNNSIPQAVIVSPGKAVVAWFHLANDSTPEKLHVSFVNPDNSTTAPKESNDYDGLTFSMVKYNTDEALIVWIGNDSIPVNVAIFDGDFQSFRNIAENSVGSSPRSNPCVAIQPGTHIPFVVWAEKDQGNNNYQVTGVPIPGIVDPCDSGSPYTRFSSGNCLYAPNNFPKILFNPADNSPIVIYGYKISSSAFIVQSQWSPVFSSNDDPQDIVAFNAISNQPLDADSEVKFNAVVDGPNYFKLVYTQNESPFQTYAAKVVPLTDSPANNLVGQSAANNLIHTEYATLTQLNQANIVSLNRPVGAEFTNLVQWEQSNKVFGGTYTPTNDVTDGQQLSVDNDGADIFSLALGIAAGYTIPVAAWIQGDGSEHAQVFAIWADETPAPESDEQVVGAAISSGVLPNPLGLKGYQRIQRFPGCCELINILAWPQSDNAAYYRVFLWPNLRTPIKTVYANQPLIVKQYGRCCGVPYYYVVTKFDSLGTRSNLSVIKIPA